MQSQAIYELKQFQERTPRPPYKERAHPTTEALTFGTRIFPIEKVHVPSQITQ